MKPVDIPVSADKDRPHPTRANVTAPVASSGPVALDRLATALGSQFSTTVVIPARRRPYLGVTCRHTMVAGEVYVDGDGWFRWPCAERIAPVGDLLSAAQRVAARLGGAIPEERPR
jgi:hypothetical protein